jgi:hypothetical protein
MAGKEMWQHKVEAKKVEAKDFPPLPDVFAESVCDDCNRNNGGDCDFAEAGKTEYCRDDPFAPATLQPRTALQHSRIGIPTAQDAVTYGVNAVYMQRLFLALIDAGYSIHMDGKETVLYYGDSYISSTPYPNGDLVKFEQYLDKEKDNG